MAPPFHRDVLDHVTRELRAADPERAFLLAFVPRRVRPAVTALTALDLEAGRILEALAGRPAAQPLLRLLAGLRGHPALLGAAGLKAIFTAREAFVREDGELSLADALLRARTTGGLLNRLVAEALLRAGYGPAPDLRAGWLAAAEEMGTAYQVTRYLGGIQREARAGRLWLPGLTAEHRATIPARAVFHGPWPAPLTALLRDLVGNVQALLTAAREHLPSPLPLAARQPFLLSAYVARDIAALAAADYDPSTAELGRLGRREVIAVWRLYLLGPTLAVQPRQPKP